MYFKNLISVILILLQFPWVSLNLNSYDMQPWIIVSLFMLALISVLTLKFKMFEGMFLVFMVLLFLSIVNMELDLDVLRRMLSGVTLVATFYVVQFYITSYGTKEFLSLLLFANFLYLLVSLMQFILGKDVLSFIMAFRGNDVRGVASLTPEPTFYGLLLVLYSVIYLHFIRISAYAGRNGRVYLYVFLLLNILAILFIAKSATALISFVIVCFVYSLLNNKSFKTKIVVSIASTLLMAVCVWVLLIYDFGRISSLINDLIVRPEQLFFSDESAKIRLGHIISPILMSYENNFLPIAESEVAKLRVLVLDLYFIPELHFEVTNNKTSSFLGGYIVSFGLFYLSLLIILFISVAKRSAAAYLALTSVLVFSLPPSLPLVSFAYAFIAHKRS